MGSKIFSSLLLFQSEKHVKLFSKMKNMSTSNQFEFGSWIAIVVAFQLSTTQRTTWNFFIYTEVLTVHWRGKGDLFPSFPLPFYSWKAAIYIELWHMAFSSLPWLLFCWHELAIIVSKKNEKATQFWFWWEALRPKGLMSWSWLLASLVWWDVERAIPLVQSGI